MNEKTIPIDEMECEELLCHETPTHIFTDDMAVDTWLCEEHAEIFPGDRVVSIEEAREND